MGRQSPNEKFSVVVVVPMANEEEEIKNPNRTVVLETDQEERQGKDELNIVELPFALISNRNSAKIKTIKQEWTGRDKLGKPKKCYQTITGSDDKGLPTFQAEMVAIAAMELTFKKELHAPKVKTTQYEMCGLLDWPYTNRYRKRLRDMFALLAGLTIETNHFYNSETREHEWAVFKIIDNAQFGSGTGFFKWNEVLFKSFKRGNIKPLNTQIYFSLKRNLSKRLFRYADRHGFNGQKHEIDLKRLCYYKLLMLGKYQGIKHLLRELQPAIDEINKLERDGIKLYDISVTKSKTTESGFKVVIRSALKSRQKAKETPERVQGHESALKPPEAQNTAQNGTSEDDQQLVDRVVAYKIPESKAREWIKEKPQIVKRQLEVLDFLIADDSHNIKNPGGRLREAIQNDWFPPPEYIAREARQKKQATQEEAKKKLMQAYQQDLAQALQDLEQVMQLSVKEQVARQLESWIGFATGYRKGERPSDSMIAKREAELIKELSSQTKEQRVDMKTREIQGKWEARDREQGIGEIDFSSTGSE